MNERDDSDFLKKEAPILSHYKRAEKSPYLMPEGYMNSLKDTLLAEAKKLEEAPKSAKVISLPNWFRPVAAAASLLLVGWVGFALWSTSDTPALADNDALLLEEIDAYVEANFDEFGEEAYDLFLSEASTEEIEEIDWTNSIQIDDLEEGFWEEIDEQLLDELL